MADINFNIYVGISRLNGLINDMRSIFTEREFELLMARAFRRTARNVKGILKEEIPKDYKAGVRWIGQSVKAPKMSFGGFDGMAVGCTIPIEGPRGVIGRRFKAAGPIGRRAKGKRYKITAQILQGKNSILPSVMKNQGGNPPFISKERTNTDKVKYVRDSKGRFAKGNISGKLKGIVFTRRTENRLPIVRVVARGVPQMAKDRSKDKIQDNIMDKLKRNIEHEYDVLIGRIKI